ncbi:MAG TPA: hypothetical protein VEL28_01945 [Candidatus Binatia bacterium]|nr:hypothetical protein [Candidatus Binatia bacterium]
MRWWLCSAVLPLLVGCAAEKTATVAEAPAAKRRQSGPGEDKCGPTLDLRKWKIQCENDTLAMMCRKSDANDRRCACKESGGYRWTYGVYCKRALPCGRRGCR